VCADELEACPPDTPFKPLGTWANSDNAQPMMFMYGKTRLVDRNE
jgi:hypothetical protein